jgi:hypothetical protein
MVALVADPGAHISSTWLSDLVLSAISFSGERSMDTESIIWSSRTRVSPPGVWRLTVMMSPGSSAGLGTIHRVTDETRPRIVIRTPTAASSAAAWVSMYFVV